MAENYEWAGPNADVARVLDKYCYGTSRPPFALMLDGAWGCGKTWFIKRFFEEKKKDRASDNEPDMIYVSLYGIQDAEEITKAIYTAMHPVLGGKVGELGKVIFKGLLKSTLKIDLHHLDKVNLSSTLGLPEYNKKTDIFKKRDKKKNIFQNRILVFDDVERAKMPVSDILALVQPLVESREDRVILVANEKEIAAGSEIERDRYERIKEKTVYLTLCINSDTKSTWKCALRKGAKNTFKEFLSDHEDEFIHFINNTETENLRILDFFITFGEDLFLFITKRYNSQEHRETILDILYLLYGLLIETRIHKRSLSEIDEIICFPAKDQMGLLDKEGETYKNEKEAYANIRIQPYFKIIQTYHSIRETLFHMLKYGVVKEDELEEGICHNFSKKEYSPSEKVLHYMNWKCRDKIYIDIIDEFKKHIDEKIPCNDEELLHICCSYKILNYIGVYDKNYEKLCNIIHKYYEKRPFNKKELENIEYNIQRDFRYSQSYFKRNYNISKEVFDIIREERKKYMDEK